MIYDGTIFPEAENSRFTVAILGAWSDSSDLNKAETPIVDNGVGHPSVFVKTSRQTDWVSEGCVPDTL